MQKASLGGLTKHLREWEHHPFHVLPASADRVGGSPRRPGNPGLQAAHPVRTLLAQKFGVASFPCRRSRNADETLKLSAGRRPETFDSRRTLRRYLQLRSSAQKQQSCKYSAAKWQCSVGVSHRQNSAAQKESSRRRSCMELYNPAICINFADKQKMLSI